MSKEFYQESSRYDINRFKSSDSAAFRRPGMPSISNDAQFAGWEAHTKGIGSKLLAKMGYKCGQGLGKHGQGITSPIEAKKREGKGAIGSEEFDDGVIFLEKRRREYSEEEIKFKKQSIIPYREVKYVFKSIDEILAETESYTKEDSSLSKVAIIDLRGPKPKEYFGYDKISIKTENIDDDEPSGGFAKIEDIPLPPPPMTQEEKLQKSMDDIRKNYRNSMTERERIKELRSESQNLQEQIDREKSVLDSLDKIFKRLKHISTDIPSNALEVEGLVLFCDDICDSCHRFGHQIEINDIIKAFCFPLIERYFQTWQVFQDPKEPLRLVVNFRKTFHSIDDTLFECLMWDIWMPAVRRSIVQWPSIRQYDELIMFFELWKPHVQEWLMAHLLSQIVLPRIEKEVQEWDPVTDRVPVHSWIHPWLPLMVDHSLEIVYAPLRSKLANILAKWHPSEPTARNLLEPWQSVFDSSTWTNLLMKNIAPKLEHAISELKINPNNQDIKPWFWVIEWSDMISADFMISLLVRKFFPRWLNVLYEWLVNGPNFLEVSRWYLGWKSTIPQVYLEDKKIQKPLTVALEMINHAISSPDGMVSYTYVDSPRLPGESDSHQADKPKTIYITDLNLKFDELVERRSLEMAISYCPQRNKYVDQIQVFRFGKLSVYIDHLVLFYNDNGQWTPIAIDEICNKVCKT